MRKAKAVSWVPGHCFQCVCVCVHTTPQVVSPSCNDEMLVKKDQCLVRAFSDSKL